MIYRAKIINFYRKHIFQGQNFQIFSDVTQISSYFRIKSFIFICIYSLSFCIIYIVFKEKKKMKK